MKRLLCMMLAAASLSLLFFAVPAKAAQTPQIVVGTAQGYAGDTVTVPVSVKNNPGFCTFRLKIKYDTEQLTLKSVKPGSQLGGTFNYAQTAVWIGTGDISADCDILTLEFTIKARASARSAEVSVSYESGNISNWAEQPVSFETVAGSVVVLARSAVADGGNTGGSGGGNLAPANTQPAQGGSGVHKVEVKLEVKGATAKITNDASDLQKQINNAKTEGAVEIDLSQSGKEVNTASLAVSMVSTIGGALSDASNAANALTVKLNTASVTMDEQTLSALAEQAKGSDLNLSVLVGDAATRLSAVQQKAVEAMDVQTVLDASFVSGGTSIHDFQGGSVTLSMPYTLKAGQSAYGLAVWHIADDGTKTRVPSAYASGEVRFTVSHFSQYVVAYDESLPSDCARDESCPMAAYSDLKLTEWYHDGVHFVLERGIMNGDGNGRFLPDAATTRAAVATVLWNMAGKPNAGVGTSFTDVPEEEWFADAVGWASANGIVNGYDGKYSPLTSVSRQDLVTILYRYAKFAGYSTEGGASLASYPDADRVEDYAKDAMSWAIGNGIINGMDGILSPASSATRAQVAAIMQRFVTNIK